MACVYLWHVVKLHCLARLGVYLPQEIIKNVRNFLCNLDRDIIHILNVPIDTSYRKLLLHIRGRRRITSSRNNLVLVSKKEK